MVDVNRAGPDEPAAGRAPADRSAHRGAPTAAADRPDPTGRPPGIVDLLSGPPGVADVELETPRSRDLPREVDLS